MPDLKAKLSKSAGVVQRKMKHNIALVEVMANNSHVDQLNLSISGKSPKVMETDRSHRQLTAASRHNLSKHHPLPLIMDILQ